MSDHGDYGDDATNITEVLFDLMMRRAAAGLTRTRLRVMALERSLARRRARRHDACGADLPGSAVQPAVLSCNRHADCGAADARAVENGRPRADHCHDDCCEDCFGS